MMSVDLLSGF